MTLLFWISVLLISYTYLGYPAWLFVRSYWRPMTVLRQPHFPSISIILVVRNEAQNLRAKLENLLDIEYPKELVEIVVVSDGSSDATNAILAEFEATSRLRMIIKATPQGKAAGINEAIKRATGDIVVFTDARQRVDRMAVAHLLENFADPNVGCASGELILGDQSSREARKGIGLYWRIEKIIRKAEAATGSVVGATGALYAVRRELLSTIPPETILDDVYIPMEVIRKGRRVVFEWQARAWDEPDLGMVREFRRKVRTLTGLYQLLRLQPWLLGQANRLRFEFISHKLMRLAVPFALTGLFVSSMFLQSPVYRFALIFQLLFYGLGACRLLFPKPRFLRRAADAPFTFVLLNTAALVAFVNFVARRKAAWGS